MASPANAQPLLLKAAAQLLNSHSIPPTALARACVACSIMPQAPENLPENEGERPCVRDTNYE